MQCSKNLKQLGLALHNYHDTFKVFPPLNTGTTHPNASWANAWMSNGNRASTFVHLLPFYEQGAVYETLKAGDPTTGNTPPGGPHPLWNWGPWTETPTVLLCPSDGGDSWSAGGPVNYAMSVGDQIWGIVGDTTPRGVFGNQSDFTIGDIKDGTSNTLAMSEIAVYDGNPLELHGGYIIDFDRSTLSASPVVCMGVKGLNGQIVGTPPDSHHRIGDAWGAGYPMINGFNTILPPNSPNCAIATGEWVDGLYPADSFHPGGVNALFCDGSVTFLTESIDTGDLAIQEPDRQSPKLRPSPYGVWGALGSKDGGESNRLYQ